MSDYERIAKVIRYMEKSFQDQPSLQELASVAGLSEFHFHRKFKKLTGITPKDFLKFLTASHAKTVLQKSRDLLTASYESGLSGPGRLHDLFVTIEAVTPGEYKSKGQGITIEYGIHSGPFGKFLIGVTKRGICYLSFDCNLSELKRTWANATIKRNQKSTKSIADQIFENKKKKKLSLLLMGTSFQIKVWEALLRIPEGYLLSYKDIALQIGSPRASRAVGSAIGSNQIAYLIPCHRVILETGLIHQYKWDPVRKKLFIVRECPPS